MNNKWVLFLIIFAIFISYNNACLAKENVISNLDMEINIQDNGNIDFFEKISGDFNLGTELYIPFENLLKSDISNYSVIENSNNFEFKDSWNIVDSRENKKGCCSIIENCDGIELVWGIGQYGKHDYIVKYTINSIFHNSELDFKLIDFNYMIIEKAKVIIKGNFDKNIFFKSNDFYSESLIEKGKIIINKEYLNKEFSIYLNYNGVDNSKKNENVKIIKSNYNKKIIIVLKKIIIIFGLIIFILGIIVFNNKKYDFYSY